MVDQNRSNENKAQARVRQLEEYVRRLEERLRFIEQGQHPQQPPLPNFPQEIQEPQGARPQPDPHPQEQGQDPQEVQPQNQPQLGQPEPRPARMSLRSICKTVCFSYCSGSQSKLKRVKTRTEEGNMAQRKPQSLTSLHQFHRDIEGKVNLPTPQPHQMRRNIDSFEQFQHESDNHGSNQSSENDSQNDSGNSNESN